MAKVYDDKNAGAIIEVNSETDFVAKNADFNAFVAQCAQIIMEQNPADVDALLACKTENGMTVEELLRGQPAQYGRGAL